MSIKLIVRETEFRTQELGGAIQDLYRALADDEARNQRIADDIVSALEEGWTPSPAGGDG